MSLKFQYKINSNDFKKIKTDKMTVQVKDEEDNTSQKKVLTLNFIKMNSL